MDNFPLVTVNILSYNRREELTNTLRKVYEQDYKNIEIIVVDNASSDGSPEMVIDNFPAVELIRLKKNIGIAGWNYGFEKAKGDYILVLDDDSYPDVSTINSAIGIMNDKTIGIVSLKIFNESRNKIENDERFSGYVNNFIGCGALISKELIQKIGGFNELLFLYSHEIEFAMRTMKSGYKIYFFKDSLITHTHSKFNRNTNAKGQDSRILYYGIRNRIIILILYFPFYKISFRIVRILFGHLFNANSFASKIIVLQGFFSIVRLFPYLFHNRNILQKEIQEKYGFGSFAGGFFFLM